MYRLLLLTAAVGNSFAGEFCDNAKGPANERLRADCDTRHKEFMDAKRECTQAKRFGTPAQAAAHCALVKDARIAFFTLKKQIKELINHVPKNHPCGSHDQHHDQIACISTFHSIGELRDGCRAKRGMTNAFDSKECKDYAAALAGIPKNKNKSGLCPRNHYFDAEKQVCRANVCSCEGGTAVSTGRCPSNDMHVCRSCDTGFLINRKKKTCVQTEELEDMEGDAMKEEGAKEGVKEEGAKEEGAKEEGAKEEGQPQGPKDDKPQGPPPGIGEQPLRPEPEVTVAPITTEEPEPARLETIETTEEPTTVEASTSAEPTTEEPTTVKATTTEEPTTEEPTTVKATTTEEPTTEEPTTVKATTTEEPTTEEPTTVKATTTEETTYEPETTTTIATTYEVDTTTLLPTTLEYEETSGVFSTTSYPPTPSSTELYTTELTTSEEPYNPLEDSYFAGSWSSEEPSLLGPCVQYVVSMPEDVFDFAGAEEFCAEHGMALATVRDTFEFSMFNAYAGSIPATQQGKEVFRREPFWIGGHKQDDSQSRKRRDVDISWVWNGNNADAILCDQWSKNYPVDGADKDCLQTNSKKFMECDTSSSVCRGGGNYVWRNEKCTVLRRPICELRTCVPETGC